MPLSTLIRRTTVASTATAMAAIGAVALGAAPAQAVTCRAYTAIGVRGTSDGSRASMGTQLPSAVSTFKAYKGATKVTTDYVNYQASFNYLASMAEGRAVLRAKINTYTKSCPSTKIALFGYSQGAHVVGDVVVGLSSAQRSRLQGVGLIGDPMLNPSFASSKTANRSYGGMWGRRASWPSGVFVYNVCNRGDQICASYTRARSLAYLAAGGVQHLRYTTSTYSPISGSSGTWLIGYHVARRA